MDGFEGSTCYPPYQTIVGKPAKMPSIKKFSITFIALWALTCLAYHYGLGSQFTDDYIAGIVRFMDVGWAGLADSYEFTSLYYGHNIVFYGFYCLFGNSPIAWFLLFTGLHSLNATLTYFFFRKLFANNQFRQANIGALAISLLFLLSPYQTENVIWGATLHYAVSMLCMWCIAWLYIAYLNSGRRLLLVCMYLLFAFALVTLEISLVFPGVFMVVFALLWQPNTTISTMARHFVNIALPMAAIIILYFSATYLIKGHFIGHYGSGTHMQFNPGTLVSTMWKYYAKLLGFAHWLPYNYQTQLYGLLDKAKVAFAILALALLAIGALYVCRKRYATFTFGWGLIIFVLLLPVLNMYFMYLVQGENDRLSYFASPFIYGLPVLLFMWLSRKLFWVYTVSMLVACMVLLQVHTHKWKQAAEVQSKAVDSPLFYNPQGDVYLLNLPVYYRGIYVFRSYNRLRLAREFHSLPNIHDNITYVLSANMQHPTDSVVVTTLPEPNTFKVELSAWGIWFWQGNRGAQNVTNDAMSITLDEWGHSYILTIPNLKPTDRLLYFANDGWHQVER